MALKKVTGMDVPASPASQTRKLNLLYVEDEDVNWEVTQANLRGRYMIDRACEAREVFQRIREKSYDAILMDIQLVKSDLNGIELVQCLRGKFKGAKPPYAVGVELPSTPIIFLTAYGARYSREELMGLGGDDLVTKPIDFTLLALSISRCLLKNVNNRMDKASS